MAAMNFLVQIVFDLLMIVVILRLWMNLVRADYYNPVSQFVVRITQPAVGPLRRLLPMVKNLDLASVALLLLLAMAKILTLSALNGFPVVWLQALQIALLLALSQTLELMFWLLLIRALLSWFSRGYNPMEALLQQLTEPLLAPVRRLLPPIGGLDLSVMVVLIGIVFLQRLLGV